MSAPVVSSHQARDSNVCCSQCNCMLRIIESPQTDQHGIPFQIEFPDQSSDLRPICEDCMDEVLENLKSEIAAANSELSMYTEALFELENDRRSGARVDDESEARLQSVTERERELMHELELLQEEETRVKTELETLSEENGVLDAEESKLRESVVALTRTILDSDESMEAVNRKLQYCQSSLRRLKRMSLLEEAFFIQTSDEAFASINGMRVGQPGVSWVEVNAGLGFACLLVDVLVKRTNISLTQYRLLPRGSYSVIIKKSDKSVLELFADEGSGGIGRFLTGRKFDAAIMAFTQIIAEVIFTLQRDDKSFQPPFTIDEGEATVGGTSIALQFNSDENWSKGIKMLFTDIKALVTYIDLKFPP